MKHISIVILAILMSMSSISCASIRDLTPFDIYGDPPQKGPIGGEKNLNICQYYLSKPMTLEYFSEDDSRPQITASGVVKVETTSHRNTIDFASSTAGALRIKDNAGKTVQDGVQAQYSEGEPVLKLQILFEENNDDYLEFYAYKSDMNDVFSLWTDSDNMVTYGGLRYQVFYSGDEKEKPYLLYKLLESEKEINTKRTAKGRKVGT